QTRRLLDRQGVHVGPEAEDLARAVAPPPDHADDARPPNAGNDLVAAESLQLFRHDAGRPMHVIEDLGMSVQVAAELRELVMHRRDAVHDRHGRWPPSGTERGWGAWWLAASLARLGGPDKCDGGLPAIVEGMHNNGRRARRAGVLWRGDQGAEAATSVRCGGPL